MSELFRDEYPAEGGHYYAELRSTKDEFIAELEDCGTWRIGTEQYSDAEFREFFRCGPRVPDAAEADRHHWVFWNRPTFLDLSSEDILGNVISKWRASKDRAWGHGKTATDAIDDLRKQLEVKVSV